ncbi:hypothetical protein ACFC8N_38955 [Streptomyces sp. NPDC055966]|uniref:hypothetical protein n=1 Tax=Streptomyces sp. NPDC055966 TaxID=3345669 RepID=UPI0035E23A2B
MLDEDGERDSGRHGRDPDLRARHRRGRLRHGGPSGNVTDFGSVTFSDATVNGRPLSGGGRDFTATWLSTG